MKIAIISDIHANLQALEETLKDIRKRNVDKIICLGDIIAKGIHPKECIKLIKNNCDVVVRGNCDRHFASDNNDINNMSEIQKLRLKWNQSMLDDEDKKYLINLPYSFEFYMSGSLVRVFHAHPVIDKQIVINEDNIDMKYEMFLPSKNTISQKTADVVIYGHIHHPYMDKIYNKTLINVGSVGNSFDVIRNKDRDSNVLETTKSNYLIIEGDYGSKEYNSDISFQFIKIPYDIDKELKNQDKNIEKEAYIKELKEGIYRQMDKINKKFKEIGIDVK